MDQASEERWRDLRRARLLEAAARVFTRLGYDSASVEDIAFEAGIGKPTLYRYFPSKEVLFEAVFARTLDELEERLDIALAAGGGFPELLRRLIGEIVPTFRTHLAAMRGLSDGEMSKRRLFRQRRARIETRLVAAIEAGQTAGEIRQYDEALAARFLIGLVWSGTNSALDDDAALSDAVVDFALAGLRGAAS